MFLLSQPFLFPHILTNLANYFRHEKRDMGLVIQRIETDGRVYRDGRLKAGDRIVEINQQPLIGVDFVRAQEILRDALRPSGGDYADAELALKVVRRINTATATTHVDLAHRPSSDLFLERTNQDDDESFNERPVEIEMPSSAPQQPRGEDKENNNNAGVPDHSNKPNVLTSYSSVNMSSLNTKRPGKKITVQLIKGPQGLGFKLAARDNCSSGEYSPIYIKSILPRGAAIADGRLQRGDRLLAVNKMDMTERTLHEAVNILRETRLGSCVELVVSRQMMPAASAQEAGISSGMLLPREMPPDEEALVEEAGGAAERERSRAAHESGVEVVSEEREATASSGAVGVNDDEKAKGRNGRRQLLTLEIALNDTGSAGLGVSVSGSLFYVLIA